jgi:FkbM family methyltransferase
MSRLHPSRFLRLISDIAGLAPTRADRARVAAVTAALWIRKRRGRRTGPLRRIRITGPRGPLTMAVGEYTDLEAIREIFVEGTYALVGRVPADTILDLGGNCGASVAYFKALHPDARIHVAEPDPVAFRTLQANTAKLKDVTLHQVAVGPVDGRLPFYQSLTGWSSSLYGDTGRPSVDVDVVRLPTLMRRAHLERVDVLKMDIEGAEWEVLPTVQLGDVAELVIGELHGPSAERQPVVDHAFAGLSVRYLTSPPSHFVAATPTGPLG